MSKWKKNIIVIVSIAIFLTVLNICIYLILKDDNNDTAVDTPIYISNYSVGSVWKIEINNEYGNLTLIENDGSWYAEGHEDIQLDQGLISEIVYMLTHIAAEREVSETEDTVDLYGMLNFSAKITTYHEGILEQTFTIGDKAPLENEYYMQSSVFKKVYTVDLAYYIYGQIKLEDLMAPEGVGISHEEIKGMHIVNILGEEFTIQKIAEDNNVSLCYWEFIEPFNHDIDTAVMYGSDIWEGMITYITELAGESVLGYTEKDSEVFGIDNPIYSAEIYDENGIAQSFVLGDYGDDDNYSAIFGDSGIIYSVSRERAPFIDYSMFIIADANLNLLNLDVVNSILIELPKINTIIDIVHKLNTKDDGSNT